MTNFDTHLVRNKRTGKISPVSSVAKDELLATGEYQSVLVRVKHGPGTPALGEVVPQPGQYVMDVTDPIPKPGDYYWRDQHLPTSGYANWYNERTGRHWTDPSLITSAYGQWLKDYVSGKASWSDMPIPQGSFLPPRPGG